MRETPETLTYGEHLPAVYRFAFLLTGSVPTAAEVLRLTVEQAERGDLSDVRDPRRVRRWLFARARSLCARPVALPEALSLPTTFLANNEGPLPNHADEAARHLAALFGTLPEPERCALVLFYLSLFDAGQLAELLDVTPDALGTLLGRGRTLLQSAELGTRNMEAETV